MNAIFLPLEFERLKIAEGGIWLDKPCDLCYGQPVRSEKCKKCNGTGFYLTESGEKVMEFLKRHYSRYEAVSIVPMVRGDKHG